MSQFDQLFEALKKIQTKTSTKRETFMTVSGYPHYENVVSNILAFFFEDSREHGMGNLWIKSFLMACGKSKEEANTYNVTVEREVPTEDSKRIDLLITTDDYVVCIENKIFADANNPFGTYEDMVNERFGKDYLKEKIVYKILSPKPIKENNTGSFTNILYSDFFQQLRDNLGDYLEECNNTWLVYMKDFLATIEGLTEGYSVNTEFEKMYQENYIEILKLQSEKNDYLKAIEKEAKNICAILEEKTEAESELAIKSLKWAVYKPQTIDLVSVWAHIYLDDSGKKITLETARDAWGWHVTLYDLKADYASKLKVDDYFKTKTLEQYKQKPFSDYYKPELHDIILNIPQSSADDYATYIADIIISTAKKIVDNCK